LTFKAILKTLGYTTFQFVNRCCSGFPVTGGIYMSVFIIYYYYMQSHSVTFHPTQVNSPRLNPS